MSLVVGFGPGQRGAEAIELGGLLARASGDDLVIACVVPDRWEAIGPARSQDAAYAAHLNSMAESVLAQAKAIAGACGPLPGVEFVVSHGRSIPQGLLDEATERRARGIVLGSSSRGAWGTLALGSVNGRLLHSAEFPIALAPRGLHPAPGRKIERVIVAVDGTEGSDYVLAAAARVSRQVGAELHAVTFAVRNKTMYPPEVGLDAEDMVVSAWREQAVVALERTVASLAMVDGVASVSDARIVDGRGWDDALRRVGFDHENRDVLVVGSSPTGPMSRVFLGSTSTRIIRHSPVPVIVLPTSGRA